MVIIYFKYEVVIHFWLSEIFTLLIYNLITLNQLFCKILLSVIKTL